MLSEHMLKTLKIAWIHLMMKNVRTDSGRHPGAKWNKSSSGRKPNSDVVNLQSKNFSVPEKPGKATFVFPLAPQWGENKIKRGHLTCALLAVNCYSNKLGKWRISEVFSSARGVCAWLCLSPIGWKASWEKTWSATRGLSSDVSCIQNSDFHFCY